MNQAFLNSPKFEAKHENLFTSGNQIQRIMKNLSNFKSPLKTIETRMMKTPERKVSFKWNRTPKACLKQKYADCLNPIRAGMAKLKVEINSDRDLAELPRLNLNLGFGGEIGAEIKFVQPSTKRTIQDLDSSFLLQGPQGDAVTGNTFQNRERKSSSIFDPIEFDHQFEKVKKLSFDCEMDCGLGKYQEDNIFSDAEEPEAGILAFKRNRRCSEPFLNWGSKNLSLLTKPPGKNSFVTPLRTHRIKKIRPPKIQSRKRKRRQGRQIEYFLANMNLDRTISSIGNLDIFSENFSDGVGSSRTLCMSPAPNHQIFGNNQNSVMTPHTPTQLRKSVFGRIEEEENSEDSLSDLRMEEMKADPKTAASKSCFQEEFEDLKNLQSDLSLRKMSKFQKKKRENNNQKMITIFNPNVVVGFRKDKPFL